VSQSVARQPVPVGQYFLERGKVTPQQLEIALQHRATFGLKLGQSLVELGFVTESDMVEALRHQARFPCIHLTSGIVDKRVAAKVGEPVARRLRALALSQFAGHTTVALEDPSDAAAIQELSHLLGTRIFPVYAAPSSINEFLTRIFGQEKGGASPRKAPTAPVPAGVPEERAVVERLRGFLQQAFEQGVSDIHLEARRAEVCVRFRLEGALRENCRLPAPWAGPTIACLKSLAGIEAERTQGEGSIPFVFKKQNFEVSVAIMPSLHGESAVLHVRGGQEPPRELAQLGLVEEQLAELESLLAARDGLLLLTGPGGNGITTTLHALLARLATPDRKVVMLAARLERELEHVLYVRRSPDETDPTATLRAIARQDPDLLVVPEIDGCETARALLEVAQSGKAVLAGMRARGSLEALVRLVRLGLEPYLLADALRGVLSQRLVRRVCQGCRAPIVPDEVLRARLGLTQDGTYFEGEGCKACEGSGHRGRLGLFEVLRPTGGLVRELEKGASLEVLERAARADGFTSLRDHGLRLARDGQITLHEVLSSSPGP
jgi:type IV pilus assembly protein PilB